MKGKAPRFSKRRIFGWLVSAGVLVLLTMFVYRGWLQVPRVSDPRAFTLVSRDGSAIANALDTAGVITNPWLFRLYLLSDRRTDRLKLGGYELREGMPYRDIVGELIRDVPKTEVRVQIIEGWTLKDIEKELVGDFGVSATSVRASIGEQANERRFSASWRKEFSFLRALPEQRSLEGYLFPDTYRVWKEQLPDTLVRKQLEAFERRVLGLVLTEKSAPLASLDEVIRLASIVEKEVATEEDRRRVAGVFLTRLREGMMLQSDATVEYVTGSGRARSTTKDLAIRSAFNTYRVKGLPPAPICNPSFSSIQAVLNPMVEGYRYFLTDADGNVLYAKTLAEHAKNRVKAGF